MNEILKVYLSVSLSASFIIVLLMLFRPLYQKRFSKRWQYYIWLIVILRLVLPWNPGNGIVGHFFQEKQVETWIGNMLDVRKAAEQGKIQGETGTQKLSSQDGMRQSSSAQANLQERILKEYTALNQPGDDSGGIAGNLDSSMETIRNRLDFDKKAQMILYHIWVIWLSVACVLLIRKIIMYQSFVKFLKAGCTVVEDIEQLEALGKVMEQSHIRRMTGLYTNSLTASPLLVGFIHPNIILTKTKLSDKDFHYTILHELTHYKRLDMFYKWLVQFVVCLHWFNPFVYLMEREISRSCELSCDEAVMKNLDAEGRREYGDTLLRAIGAGGGDCNTQAALTLHKSRELLRERLGEIMNHKKQTRLTMVLSAAVALILAGSAVAAGAYVQPAAAEKRAGEVQLPDCKMIQKEGVFYILCEGADEQDMPTSSVTEGSVCITLVRKDGYTTIGPFDDMDRLVQDVTKMLALMLEKKDLTEAEVQLCIEAADKIQKNALGVNINWTSVSIQKGKSVTLKLTGTKKQAVWSSGNKKIAAVNKNGKVTAKKAGSTKVTAKIGGRTYVCKVKVTDTAENKNKAKEAAAEVYQALGITEKNGVYFYNGKRIRIFMDIRADQSFVHFSYDKQGSIDVKLRRKEDFSATGVEYLTEAETEEILQEMDESETEPQAGKPEISIARLSRRDLPDEVLEAIGGCKDGTWYVIRHGGYQYIYYQGLPNDYAFQPALSGLKADIKIADMKKTGRYDVLLAVKKNVELTIYYRGREVRYERL